MAFPATYNFDYYRGDSFEFIVFPKNANGSSFDLSSFDTKLFTIATQRGIAGEEVGLGTIISSSTSLLCKITPSLGDAMDSATYVYDIQIEDTSASTKYTLLTGNISVTQDVSERAT
jgi:hypothetical protein